MFADGLAGVECHWRKSRSNAARSAGGKVFNCSRKLAQLRSRLTPRVHSIDRAVGGLTATWAKKTGLTAGIPVAVGAFDAHLGAVGSGVAPGCLVKIIGTSTCDIAISPNTKQLADVPGLCGIVDGSVLPGYFGLEAGQSAVGDLFNWLVNYIEPGGKEAGSHIELTAWMAGLKSFEAVLLMGAVLGFAGASFAVALPQAGRWYPPNMQGLVLGLAGAGNIGVVIDSILAPRLAKVYGWQSVFGFALVPAVLVLAAYVIFSREAPVQVTPKKLTDYLRLFRDKDTHWFCFYYTVSFGGFVGLASSFVIYFKDRFGLLAVQAGDLAALCTAVGALARPVGGALADRIGGIRALYFFYAVAGIALLAGGLVPQLAFNVASFVIACGAFGMANGSVFQLLPQRFGKEIGLMTGLVGCGGGVGGFLMASLLGLSKQYTGQYLLGLLFFAVLCLAALAGLGLVKKRWRTTWGALAQARI